MTQEDKVSKIQEIIKQKITGVWEPRHDDNGHRYYHNPSGYMQRSVTTKLGILSKPHLLGWAVRVGIDFLLQDNRLERLRNPQWKDELITGATLAHIELRDQAGSTGSKTHFWAERFLNQWIADGEMPKDIKVFMDITKDDPRAIAGARSFELLCKQKDIIPIASELIVGMPKISAGALDILCFWKGELCLLDIKTSNSIDKNFRYQLAAYRAMLSYMTGLKIKKVKIIHLSKDMAKYVVYDVKDLIQGWKTFKHICAVYDDVMSSKEKIVKDVKRLSI
tara:strand:- start:822 stop:1658 length:837 start_codon:yes stop_codon:yes gene_type:complete